MGEAIINPIDLYWLNVLDSIDTFALVASVLFAVAVVALIVSVAYNADMKSCCEENAIYYRICKTWLIVCVVLLPISILAAIFIPDKNTMIEMMVAKYATYENIQLTMDGVKEIVDYIVKAISALK